MRLDHSTATSASTAVQTRYPLNTQNDADGDDGAQVQGSGGLQPRRHAHISSDMLQALQSMGVNLTGTTTSTSGTSSDSSSSTSSTTGSASLDPKAIRKDIHQVIHAMFDAMRASSGQGAGDVGAAQANGSAQGPQAQFAANLSALISQAANGTAPAGLTQAFSQLNQDLQASGALGSGATLNLQDFLSKLQAGMGYTASGGSSTASLSTPGQTVSTTA